MFIEVRLNDDTLSAVDSNFARMSESPSSVNPKIEDLHASVFSDLWLVVQLNSLLRIWCVQQTSEKHLLLRSLVLDDRLWLVSENFIRSWLTELLHRQTYLRNCEIVFCVSHFGKIVSRDLG